MPQPLARVVRMLEERGYVHHSRREYPGRRNTFFYLFSHPNLPWIGVPVVREQVAMRHYYRIRDLLQGFGDEPKEEE